MGMRPKVMRIVETILSSSLVLLAALTIGVCSLICECNPTDRITLETYQDIKNAVSKGNNGNSWQLDIAKAKFENAIEEAGYQVDDSVVQVWEEEGIATIAYLWKSGDFYYNTQVRNEQFQYPFKEAVYIQGQTACRGDITSARYDNSGYLIVDSNIDLG